MQALESSFSLNYSYLQLCQHLVMILLATHWVACLAILVSRFDSMYSNDQHEPMFDHITGVAGYITAIYWCAPVRTWASFHNIVDLAGE
jgi:hypothetical protein